MLIPLRNLELQKLIPSVATSNQFSAALGNPRKILQRIIISSIGGVITLLISQSQVSSQFYSLWLVLGVVFLLYILWGPIVEASRINSKLRGYPFSAIFEGDILDIIATKNSIYGYLAIKGGFKLKKYFSSVSTNVRSMIGPNRGKKIVAKLKKEKK